MKRDVSIQLIRILSMFLIIIGCHLISEFGNDILKKAGQIFNVGVYIFLFISGYLYGDKIIKNKKKWYFKRLKRILIPMYIFMVFVFALYALKGNLELSQSYIYIYIEFAVLFRCYRGDWASMVFNNYYDMLFFDSYIRKN